MDYYRTYATGRVATSPLVSVSLVGRVSAVLTSAGRLAVLTETEDSVRRSSWCIFYLFIKHSAVIIRYSKYNTSILLKESCLQSVRNF